MLPIWYQSVTSAIYILFSNKSDIVILDFVKKLTFNGGVEESRMMRKFKIYQVHQYLLVINIWMGLVTKVINIDLSLVRKVVMRHHLSSQHFWEIHHVWSNGSIKFGEKIHRLRCDGGGEYVANEMKSFCMKKEIIIECTVY